MPAPQEPRSPRPETEYTWYEMQGGSIELQWNYSTDGHWDE